MLFFIKLCKFIKNYIFYFRIFIIKVYHYFFFFLGNFRDFGNNGRNNCG